MVLYIKMIGEWEKFIAFTAKNLSTHDIWLLTNLDIQKVSYH